MILQPVVSIQARLILTLVLMTTVTLAQPSCAAEPSSAAGEEWIQLFNGRDLNDWVVKIKGFSLGSNYGDTFRVEDGLLKVSYDKYEGPFRGRFGHLFYKTPFSHYVLRVEYRIVGQQYQGGPGWALRNSGVMIHGQTPESMEKDQNFPVSAEVQLLGGDGSNPRPTANLCTPGTNVVMDDKLHLAHCVNSISKTYHGDQWITVEIEVHGNGAIRHKLGGNTVIEYSKTQLDERDEFAKKLMAAGSKKMVSGGSISLQSESHPIEFRKVELRKLAE